MILKLAAALLFIGLNFYTFHHLATEDVVPPRTSFEAFPDRVDTWECVERISMDDAKTSGDLGNRIWAASEMYRATSDHYVDIDFTG